MPPSQRLFRLAILLLGFAALVGGTSLLAFRFSLAMGLAELQATGRHRLDLYATSLEREIDKYAYFSTTLGLERDVMQLLASPAPERSRQVNQYLEQLNEAYSQFFHFYDESPLLIVNAAAIDFANDDNHYTELVEYLLNVRAGRQYFNPTFFS